MVMFLLIGSPPLVRTMVPVTAKLIVSPSFAALGPDVTSPGRCHVCW